MRSLLLIFTVVSLLIAGCRKKKEPGTKEYPIPGDLLIGISNNANLKTVFDTLNTLDLEIASMNNFSYNVNLPADSVKPLLVYLNTKSYINTGTSQRASGSYYAPENVIRLSISCFNMTLVNQRDFLNTIDSLKFTNRPEGKFMEIKVPVGQEEYWLIEMQKYSFVTYAEQNMLITNALF